MTEIGGSIINVTSDAGVVGYPGWGAYGISKFGLEGMSQTWASELEETGVRVNWVDPGNMNTAMHRAAEPEEDPSQWADPADVTEVFLFRLPMNPRTSRAGAFKRRKIGGRRRQRRPTRKTRQPLGRMTAPFRFVLPEELSAKEPPERRGLARDQVKLLVIDRATHELAHSRFDRIGEFLRAGDLLVFNSSRTLPASLNGCGASHGPCIEIAPGAALARRFLAGAFALPRRRSVCLRFASGAGNRIAGRPNRYRPGTRRKHSALVAASFFKVGHGFDRSHLSPWKSDPLRIRLRALGS